MNLLEIDVYKRESHVAVSDDDGEVDREIRVGVVCERAEPLESLSTVIKDNQRSLLVRRLSRGELDRAIAEARKADETRLVRRLCYVKNLYHGDTREEADDRIEIP